MISSPWAMLITPIWPNVNVSPMATRSRIEPWLTPLKTCSRNVSTDRYRLHSPRAKPFGPVVAADARIGVDRALGRPHLVDQAVGVDLADAGRLGDVLVPVADGDRAFR